MYLDDFNLKDVRSTQDEWGSRLAHLIDKLRISGVYYDIYTEVFRRKTVKIPPST